MTLHFPLIEFFVRSPFPATQRRVRVSLLAAALCGALACGAQSKAPAPNTAPDVLVLSNGDTLHGKFVNALGGKVTFHSDPLGNISLPWTSIKELHTTEKFAVLNSTVKQRGRKSIGQVPKGTLDVADQAVTVHSENTAPLAPIPVKDAQFILDEPTFEKNVIHQPGFLSGWNGAATAGATVVTATQKQYTFSGGFGLVRAVPTVGWLNPRDRTSLDFTGSFGKITDPGYDATPGDPSTYVPETVTKSAIYHADAERDEYVSPRFFALAQVAFDHNFSQDLDLQQIYGGGMGWTIFKTPKQEADVKATIQYEKQQFISGASGNQNLIGSTFAANYLLHMKLVTYTQGLAFIPAYNDARAYSANETNTFAFPTYKNLSFSLGTIDSYLNDPPVSLPPTKRNSFQFTMGLTYAISSKY
jgi:Protein of unknown function, DUF481